MEYKECLTNEQLLRRFGNQFDLVRYAIDIATGQIRAGRDQIGFFDTDNVAHQVLGDIAAGREILMPVEKKEEAEVKKPEFPEKKEKKAKTRSLR